MNNIVVIIEDGIVSSVFSNDETVGVTVVSYDRDKDSASALNALYEDYRNKMGKVIPEILHPGEKEPVAADDEDDEDGDYEPEYMSREWCEMECIDYDDSDEPDEED